MAPSSLLIVCDFNGHGGTQTQVLELLGALDRTRVKPMLATLSLDRALGRSLQSLEVPVQNLDLRGALRPATFRALGRLARTIRREGVQLVHGFLFQGNLAAALAARRAGVPYLTSVRNLDLRKGPHEVLASRWAHQGASRVTFNSRHVRDRVAARERLALERTRIIPNGLRLHGGSGRAGLELWPEGSDARLVCVASLSPKKGHRYLLDAFADVLRRFPRAGLLLVGEGAERARIECRARELGIASRVRLAGRREDARALIAAADLLVLPSLEEGMPNVILEAMAAGVPQVATAVGGTSEIVEAGATGFLVPARDPLLMSERIGKLLGNPRLRETLGRKARELFERRHAVEPMARAHEELYSEVLAEAA